MRFFEAQKQARRQSVRLVLLYAAALLLSVAALTWVTGWLFPGDTDNTAKYAYTASAWLALMLGASVYRLRQLSGGGWVVAEALGGERLLAHEADRQQRRLINVVEEMALAAMLPVPKIYLLPDAGINAFAAGTSPENAVIGITRGALRQLDRAELQAVVAHEFSHIANGDMLLNMRLTGWLFGLQLVGVCGRHLFFDGAGGGDGLAHKKSDEALKKEAEEAVAGCLLLMPYMLVGGTLMLVGGLGSLLAGWIQAAICRQREYLADASAVQFTRQTDGMVGALHKIAVAPVHRLQSWHAAEYAHFMFGSVREPDILDKLAATHPATIERIRRLSPFRARDLADEIGAAESLRLVGYEGLFAFGGAGGKADWDDAEADAAMLEAEQRAEAMRRRIEAFRPGMAARTAEWQRQAPNAWRSAAADGERLPLLLACMLAGVDGIPADLQQQWAKHNPLRAETLARLQQKPLPAAYYIDVLESMLPHAAADELLPALCAEAQQLFAANRAPSLMQGCVWLLLQAYAGCRNVENRPAQEKSGNDTAQIAAFAALVLPVSFQTASVNIPQAAWQSLQTALDDAAGRPEAVRRQILADCSRYAETANDRLRADALLHTLGVSLGVAAAAD
ncbi:MAG: M48 family metalloprotease [Neisseria sp.]|nr:M48 family metalloprotease [Neisseria sp.]